VNDLDIEGLVGSVLRGVLTSRGKRSHGAFRYLAGSGGSSFLNASTLLTLGGLAWGLWETSQAQTAQQASPRPWPSAPGAGLTVPPPIPPDMAPVATVVPPPIPSNAPAPPPASAEIGRAHV